MLRFEWYALRNASRTKSGREALLGSAIVLACLVVVGLVFASHLSAPETLALIADQQSGAFAGLLFGLLLLGIVLVVAFARVPCRSQLFEGSHVPAKLASPASPLRILHAVWLRQASAAIAAVLAVAFVPACTVALRAGLPVASILGFLMLLLLAIAATVAVVLLLLVWSTRLLSGGRLRRVLALLHVTFAGAVVVLLLLGFGRGDQVQTWLLGLRPDTAVIGTVVQYAVRLPTAVAAGEVVLAAWFAPMLLLAVTSVSLALAARSYRGAYQANLCATPVTGSGRLRVGKSHRPWPRAVVPSLVRRSMLQAWRVRGNLVAILLLATYAVYGPASSPFVSPATDAHPVVRQAFYLLSPWLLMSSLLALLSLLSVVGDDQQQLPLIATAPVSRRDLVRARLRLLAWPFLLTVGLVALAGCMVGKVSLAGAFAFLLTALPVAVILVGAAGAIGSWPRFIAVHQQMPLANNVRTVVPVLVMSVVTAALLFASFGARKLLLGGLPGEGNWLALLVLVGWWLIALGLHWCFGRVALRNLTQLFGPQAQA